MTAQQARRAPPESGPQLRPVLPSKDELLAALRGHYLQGPLCEQAYGLAEVHRQSRHHPERAEELAALRRRLIDEIDEWTARMLPAARPSAPLTAESFGTVIDRMAAAADHAFDLLMTIDLGSGEMHGAWTRLAELEIQYGELVTALLSGWRRLP